MVHVQVFWKSTTYLYVPYSNGLFFNFTYTFAETRVQALLLSEQKIGMGELLAQDTHADSTMLHSF